MQLSAEISLAQDPVAMGTRFVASRDNTDWDLAYAQRILDAREAEDIIFSAIYGPSRALPSRGIDELALLTAQGTDHEALTRFKDERLIAGQRDGDMQGGILPSGQVAGVISELIDVATFIPSMVDEAIRILRQLAPRSADGAAGNAL